MVKNPSVVLVVDCPVWATTETPLKPCCSMLLIVGSLMRPLSFAPGLR